MNRTRKFFLLFAFRNHWHTEDQGTLNQIPVSQVLWSQQNLLIETDSRRGSASSSLFFFFLFWTWMLFHLFFKTAKWTSRPVRDTCARGRKFPIAEQRSRLIFVHDSSTKSFSVMNKREKLYEGYFDARTSLPPKYIAVMRCKVQHPNCRDHRIEIQFRQWRNPRFWDWIVPTHVWTQRPCDCNAHFSSWIKSVWHLIENGNLDIAFDAESHKRLEISCINSHKLRKWRHGKWDNRGPQGTTFSAIL